MEAKKRKDAIKDGSSFYFTGKPCLRGHIAKRSTNKGLCVECRNLVARETYRANPGKQAERAKDFALRNPGYAAIQSKQWRQNNKDRQREYASSYAKNNAEVYAFHKERRRASMSRASMGSDELDTLVFTEARDLARRRCVATGFKWHVDHIIPIRCKTACGLHVAANIQVIPAWMNLAKKNKMMFCRDHEWISLA